MCERERMEFELVPSYFLSKSVTIKHQSHPHTIISNKGLLKQEMIGREGRVYLNILHKLQRSVCSSIDPDISSSVTFSPR